MNSEIPNLKRQDLGYGLLEQDMTLESAQALHSQGLGGKKAARLVKKEQDRLFFDAQHGVDSSLSPLTEQEVERSHRGYKLASRALKEAQEARKMNNPDA